MSHDQSEDWRHNFLKLFILFSYFRSLFTAFSNGRCVLCTIGGVGCVHVIDTYNF